ncbi:serine/threonine protein kinase [Fortiea contorta]|uniref:serine/threonine protein kinase n=1 Tax=Fortiea contorta TaxID=1892405 RepID=UPI00034AA46A|nr:serine/threonine-protein kinase [Fortiea contorta]
MIPEIEPGTVVNSRYQIQKTLGKGGFGRTYLAFDSQRFDEPCVLKEFFPTVSKEENLGKSKDLFTREAKVLYQIQHPQIPKFLAWFTDNQRIFIVQEYIDGKTYADILSERQPFSEIEVRTWLLDILPVLQYLHDRQIIHRDISLENIMLPHNQSQPVLIDFGAVKENFTQIAASGFYHSIRSSVVGKFGYSPPEQLRLGYAYPSSDIYALGVCAVVMLTGKMPQYLLDESLNWQWSTHVNIGDAFTKILDKMLAEKALARYQSAAEIILALNKLQNDSSVIPRLNFKITSPLEILKIRKIQQETQQALADLLILQDLEQKLRNYHDYHNLPKTIYLHLDLSTYIQQQSLTVSESSSHGSIKFPAIATKINDIFSKKNSKPVTTNRNIKIDTQEFLQTAVATNNLQILEIIKKEFTNFIGPISNFLINEALAIFPNCSSQQLIEILAAEIPDKSMAQQFQEGIHHIIESKLHLLQES